MTVYTYKDNILLRRSVSWVYLKLGEDHQNMICLSFVVNFRVIQLFTVKVSVPLNILQSSNLF